LSWKTNNKIGRQARRGDRKKPQFVEPHVIYTATLQKNVSADDPKLTLLAEARETLDTCIGRGQKLEHRVYVCLCECFLFLPLAAQISKVEEERHAPIQRGREADNYSGKNIVSVCVKPVLLADEGDTMATSGDEETQFVNMFEREAARVRVCV
jgi:hypothetical protein